MKKIIALLLCLVIVLLFSLYGCSEKDAFVFNPKKYTIVDNSSGGDRFVPQSIQDLEKLVRFDELGEPITDGAIILCTISGDSINRILEPPASEREPGVVYGINHVLTPVKIERVLYSGADTSLEEGKEYYLREPYFYVTEETPDYYTEYGKNHIYATDYYPMTKGNTYLVYITQKTQKSYDYLKYQGEIPLIMVSFQEAVYCLGDTDRAKSVCITEDENYWKLWNEAKLLYEDIFASAK